MRLPEPVLELTAGADALLVLGGEDRTQWHRSSAAVRYYLACKTAGVALPRLLVTGGAPVRQPATGLRADMNMNLDTGGKAAILTEAAWMAHFMQAQGVPAAHILQEAQALDTLGNVALGGALAARHGLRRLVVVSDDFHLWRAQRLFKRVWGCDPAGCLATGNNGAWRLRLREKLAFVLQTAALRQAGVAPGHSAAHLDFLSARKEKSL